jgi:hypothetical protein
VRGGGGTLAGVGAATAAFAGMACLPYAFGAPQVEDPDKDANLRTCRNIALVGAVMVAIGIPLFVYGHGGAATEDTAVAKQTREDGARRYAELEERFRVTREHAWTSTREAATAARAGDCGTVLVRARYVYNLDAEFYASVFARDAAIFACLPTPRDPAKDREQAFALLKTATSDARAGNCTAVVDAESKIRELDTNVHDAWFVRDDAIKACLTPATPALESRLRERSIRVVDDRDA